MQPNDPAERRTKVTCPVCGRRFWMDETEAPPFCSHRCKMIDLGAWLNEEHGLPYEGDPDAAERPDDYGEEYGG